MLHASVQWRGAAGAPTRSEQPAPPQGFRVEINSADLQQFRSPEGLASALVEAAYEGINLAIGWRGAHIAPDRVAADLPAFVDGLRRNGVQVATLTCPIAHANSPDAARILETAASLGVRRYIWTGFHYRERAPIRPQIEVFKARLAKLAELNARYEIRGLYLPSTEPGAVGADVWDILEILRVADPCHVGLQYRPGAWVKGVGLGVLSGAGAYVGGIVLRRSVCDLPRLGAAFRAMAFRGPFEIRCEGAGGQAELVAMTGDRLALEAVFKPLGLV